MVNYEVTVFTGNLTGSATLSHVYIKLVGTNGTSARTQIMCPFSSVVSYFRGGVTHLQLSCATSLGKLELIKFDKDHLPLFPEDFWFCKKVQVRSPEGDTYIFPIYHWIRNNEINVYREGKALTIFEENSNDAMYSRKKELKQKAEDFCWDVDAEKILHCIKAEGPCSLPYEVQFSYTKFGEFFRTAAGGVIKCNWWWLTYCKKPWQNFDDIRAMFSSYRTDISDYVQEHWKEDAFFGYQYLNGVNPMLIQCCRSLPKNFPVTDDMVSLNGGKSLAAEMMDGNIFLCNYNHLDGLETNTINGKKQYLAAPLVLLHQTPDDKMMPIAIQLKQQPAEDNPIFLPTDSEYDWLTAKLFVRGADFSEHQLNVHLLRTHLLAEVFTMSLLRNLPMVHPVYKLLIAHTRYTLQINVLARDSLISKEGVFTKFAASGGEGMITFLRRSLSSLTYTSLCIPDDIAERGLESVPNFYYRDDGLRLWDIIHRFVQGMLKYYYKRDTDVQKDSELQKWISDIFEHGLFSQANTGIPRRLTTVAELIKFVTMVIFTGSAQHAAVNSGQFDYGGWMPNTPSSLQRPPPTTKGTTSEATMLQTFPDRNTSAQIMVILWLLSQQSKDTVRLGDYQEEHFTEQIPRKLIKDFQEDLKKLSEDIKLRNEDLEVQYTYLDPALVENSVAI